MKLLLLMLQRKNAKARILALATLGLLVVLLGQGCASKCRFDKPLLPTSDDTRRLHARYYGVSTILLADDQDAILIDGFFSRPNLIGLLVGFQPKDKRINYVLKTTLQGPVEGVFVAHNHHDHALDAPTLAKEKKAPLFGSDAVLKNAKKTHDNLVLLKNRCPIKVGRFTIIPIETPHAEAPWPVRVLERMTIFPGVRQFQVDTNFAFYIKHPDANVLILPSAALPADGFGDIRPDVVFLGIAYLARQGPDMIEKYWRQSLASDTVKLVIPVHWDNLMGDLNKSLRPIPRPFDNVYDAADQLNLLAEKDVKNNKYKNAPVIKYAPIGDAVALSPYGAGNPEPTQPAPPSRVAP